MTELEAAIAKVLLTRIGGYRASESDAETDAKIILAAVPDGWSKIGGRSTDQEPTPPAPIDAFVRCWTEVMQSDGHGVKTSVGAYEIVVRHKTPGGALLGLRTIPTDQEPTP